MNIYHGNDNVLELKGVVDFNGNFLNAAVVTAKILDKAGVEVAATGYAAQTLAYVPASSGNYQKIVDKAVYDGLPESNYQIEWTASEGGADYRRCDNVRIGKRRV